MTPTELLILILFAFLPPSIYAIWIRNTERHHREKWKPVILSFLWGATIAVIAAIILEIVLDVSLAASFPNYSIFGLSIAIFIAPFAEELTKPLALRTKTVKKELDELEDGFIYGAVAGLGFSATENLLYGYSFHLQEITFVTFIILMALRSFGACLLHASATALTGYGYGKTIIARTSLVRVIPYFLLAMGVHAFYNFLLSYPLFGAPASLLMALGFSVIAIHYVRKRIRILDATGSS